MKSRLASILLGVSLVALIAGCASFRHRESDQEALQRYLAYAQPPVKSFTYLGRLDGWRPLGHSHLVVWTTPGKAYLLEVQGPCNDLPFASRVGLTSTGSMVSTGFDYITLRRGERCVISEIRPVDDKQLKADARAEHQAAKKSDTKAE